MMKMIGMNKSTRRFLTTMLVMTIPQNGTSFVSSYNNNKNYRMNDVMLLLNNRRRTTTPIMIPSSTYFHASSMLQSKRRTNKDDIIDEDNLVDIESSSSEMEYHSSATDDDDNSEEEEEEEEEEEKKEEVVLYELMEESVKRAIESLEKKQASLEMELSKSQAYEEKMERANFIIANLYQIPEGCTSIEIMDWTTNSNIELKLNPKKYNTAQEEANALFASARKMKRGSIIVQQLLQDLTSPYQQLLFLQDQLLSSTNNNNNDDNNKLELSKLQLLLQQLEQSSKQTGFQLLTTTSKQQQQQQQQSRNLKKNTQKKKNNRKKYVPSFRQFVSEGGCHIWVGKTRRDNEAICFQVAKPTDIWMHARGCPGAHVLIKVRRGSPTPTDACLQLAANLAAFYSDARTELKAPITSCLAKHLQKPRRAPPGAVKVRYEGPTYLGNPTHVPSECIQQRNESGQPPAEFGNTHNRQSKRNNNNNNNASRERKSRVRRLQSTDDDTMDFF